MRIHTKIVLDMASGEILEDEHYDYEGPVTRVKGGGGGGSSGGTQTTVQEPWSGQQPFLTSGFQRAEQQFGQPLQFFPESTVVPFAPQTETALGAQEQRATAGSPLLGAAQSEIGRGLSGEYLSGGNPAFAGMLERSIRPLRREFTETVLPGIASGYARGGRLPGGPTDIPGGAFETTQNRAADTYMRNVGDVASRLAFGTYEGERPRMMQAARMAPGLAREDYADISRLRDVGAAREQLSSAELPALPAS